MESAGASPTIIRIGPTNDGGKWDSNGKPPAPAASEGSIAETNSREGAHDTDVAPACNGGNSGDSGNNNSNSNDNNNSKGDARGEIADDAVDAAIKVGNTVNQHAHILNKPVNTPNESANTVNTANASGGARVSESGSGVGAGAGAGGDFLEMDVIVNPPAVTSLECSVALPMAGFSIIAQEEAEFATGMAWEWLREGPSIGDCAERGGGKGGGGGGKRRKDKSGGQGGSQLGVGEDGGGGGTGACSMRALLFEAKRSRRRGAHFCFCCVYLKIVNHRVSTSPSFLLPSFFTFCFVHTSQPPIAPTREPLPHSAYAAR